MFCHLSLVLDADLRFALDSRHDNDIARRCLVYVHKVVNAKGEREKEKINSQLSEVKVIHHFLTTIYLLVFLLTWTCSAPCAALHFLSQPLEHYYLFFFPFLNGLRKKNISNI